MRWQLIAMGMRMGRVLGWERGLFEYFMRRVRERMIKGVVPGVFKVALPIPAGAGLNFGFHVAL
jgi:hypothetical protein